MRTLFVLAPACAVLILAAAPVPSAPPPVAHSLASAAAVPVKAAPKAGPTKTNVVPKANPPPPAPVVPANVLAVALATESARDAGRLLLQPYADATATKLAIVPWDGTPDGLARTQADLVLAGGPALTAGCRAQTLIRLDWSELDRDRYLPLAATDCGAGAYVAATVLAWDRDKLPATPNWADFWDVARAPGRRGLQHTPRGNLEIALLADGVAQGDVYRALRTQDGVDRAFRKLDQLKPYIVWWDQPAQPAQFLGDGRVLLTSAPAGALLAAGSAAHRHFAVQPAGALTEIASWAIPRQATHPAAAVTAMVVAGDIARQALFADATGQGPALHDALDIMPAEARDRSPAANLAGSLAIDEGFWLDNHDKLDARFAAWLAKP